MMNQLKQNCILENQNDNIESIPDKTIVYTNFKDKKIYTTVGGIIEKGKCEDNNYPSILIKALSEKFAFYFYFLS